MVLERYTAARRRPSALELVGVGVGVGEDQHSTNRLSFPRQPVVDSRPMGQIRPLDVSKPGAFEDA